MIENPQGDREILRRQPGQRRLAHLPGKDFHTLDGRLAERGQDDGLGAPVLALATLDQSREFQRIEQPHDGGPIQRERCGQILLVHRMGRPGDAQQRQPGGLRQAEGLQVAIDRAPPLARGVREKGPEAVALMDRKNGHGNGSNSAWQIDDMPSISRQLIPGEGSRAFRTWMLRHGNKAVFTRIPALAASPAL
ncbi:hypothetical protein CHELA17_60050 [Chelatococcus asaccharovorans]|nr:hypothetical protein CHELA17_60050 [Chelatococcus asaccharovorans]